MKEEIESIVNTSIGMVSVTVKLFKASVSETKSRRIASKSHKFIKEIVNLVTNKTK